MGGGGWGRHGCGDDDGGGGEWCGGVKKVENGFNARNRNLETNHAAQTVVNDISPSLLIKTRDPASELPLNCSPILLWNPFEMSIVGGDRTGAAFWSAYV